jgi:type II secretion system protein N
VQFPQLDPRLRKPLRYAGIALLGIVTFVFALQMALPVERVRDKVIEGLSPSYEVTIGKVERGFLPGRVYFHMVSLRTRPTKPDDPITTFVIDKLEVNVGIFALLTGKLSIDFDAKIGNGDLYGNISLPGFGKKGLALHVTGKDVPGDGLPMRAVLGLPMTGKLELAADLDLPNEPRNGKVAANWQKAEGSFEFSCPSSCTFGDGKTKLRPLLKNRTNQVMVGDGIEFGKVEIDTMIAQAEFKDGNFTVTKFDTKSHDGELHVDYTMKLAPDLMDSMVTGCLRFNASDALLKREPKTYAAINTTGAERRGDGLFHITLADVLRDMKRLNQECGPNAHGSTFEGGPHTAVRPNITVMPDEPAKPTGPVTSPAIAAPIAAPPPTPAPPGAPGAGSAEPPGGSAGSAPIAPSIGGSAPGAAAPTPTEGPGGVTAPPAPGSAQGGSAKPNEGIQ